MRESLNFEGMITEGARHWWDVGRALGAVKKVPAVAANDPVLSLGSCSMRDFAYVRVKQQKLQTYLREGCGVEVDDSLENWPQIRVVDEELARTRTLFEVYFRCYVLTSLLTYNAAWWAMMHAFRQSAAARLAKVARSVVDGEVRSYYAHLATQLSSCGRAGCVRPCHAERSDSVRATCPAWRKSTACAAA
jgi:hypothetical protein